MIDWFVVVIVFAFAQGPGVNTTPLYFGQDDVKCESEADNYNVTHLLSRYKRAVCLEVGTVYDPNNDPTPLQQGVMYEYN
tara:strand:+ start:141 stop:380 length:240 start_codon:yes stop_codon:yes gene_type:complete